MATSLELLRASEDPERRRILKVFADREDETIALGDLEEFSGLKAIELRDRLQMLEDTMILTRPRRGNALRLNPGIDVGVLRIILDAAAGTFGLDEQKRRRS